MALSSKRNLSLQVRRNVHPAVIGDKNGRNPIPLYDRHSSLHPQTANSRGQCIQRHSFLPNERDGEQARASRHSGPWVNDVMKSLPLVEKTLLIGATGDNCLVFQRNPCHGVSRFLKGILNSDVLYLPHRDHSPAKIVPRILNPILLQDAADLIGRISFNNTAQIQFDSLLFQKSGPVNAIQLQMFNPATEPAVLHIRF